MDPRLGHMYRPVALAAFIWRLILTTGSGSIFGFMIVAQRLSLDAGGADVHRAFAVLRPGGLHPGDVCGSMQHRAEISLAGIAAPLTHPAGDR